MRHWLQSLKRVIWCSGTTTVYLVRFTLAAAIGRAIYLHKFVESDIEIFHDHPWNFVSVIVRGGYIEHRPGRTPETRLAGSIACRSATDLHYVTLLRSPTWTLVIRGVRTRLWGFQTANGWVPWHKYVREKYAVDSTVMPDPQPATRNPQPGALHA